MADKTDFNDFAPAVGDEAIKEKIEQAAQIKESDQEAYARLAKLSPGDYDRARKKEAESLGIRVETLDKEVSKSRGETGGSEKDSVATSLVQLAEESGVELWHGQDAKPWVTLVFDGHVEYHPLKGKAARRYLAESYYKERGRAAHAQGIQDALMVLEAKALFEGEEHPTYIRIAEIERTIYLDLTNERWEVVRITAHGWAVIPMDQGQARFKRARGMLPIPTPIPSDISIISVFSATGTPQKSVGKQKSLAEVIGIPANSSAWRLTVGFILCAFRGSIPYPVLVINGEQGSGKSTRAKLLRSFLDPSTAPLRSLPRDKRDLFISAVNSWVLCFDSQRSARLVVRRIVQGLHRWRGLCQGALYR